MMEEEAVKQTQRDEQSSSRLLLLPVAPLLPLLAVGASQAAAAAQQHFVTDGAVGLRGIISAQTAKAAAAAVDRALAAAVVSEAQSEQDARYLGPVRSLINRWDLRLHFTGAVKAAVVEPLMRYAH